MFDKILKLLKSMNIELTEDQEKKLKAEFDKKDDVDPKDEKTFLDRIKEMFAEKKEESGKKTDDLDASETKALIKQIANELAKTQRERDELNKQLNKFQENSRNKEIKSFLKSAVDSGKITAEEGKFSDKDDEKGVWQKRLEKDFDGYKQVIDERKADPNVNKDKDKKDNSGDKDKDKKQPGLMASSVNTEVLDYVSKQFNNK